MEHKSLLEQQSMYLHQPLYLGISLIEEKLWSKWIHQIAYQQICIHSNSTKQTFLVWGISERPIQSLQAVLIFTKMWLWQSILYPTA